MSLSKLASRRRGFTLIELLIVIVVIAILALIVIPRLMGASRKAKDSTLKGNLHIIRQAVENFYSDTGLYPLALDALVAEPENGIAVSGSTLTNTALPDGVWKGPYLRAQGGIVGTRIPRNPYVPASSAATAHWTLVTTPAATVGDVNFPTPTGSDAEGDPYSTY